MEGVGDEEAGAGWGRDNASFAVRGAGILSHWEAAWASNTCSISRLDLGLLDLTAAPRDDWRSRGRGGGGG